MKVILENTDVLPICVKHLRLSTELAPRTQLEMETDSEGYLKIELMHNVKDRFHPVWYILNEIFSLEQMRTVLVVDGIYLIKPVQDGAVVKIKSYEYVFHKKVSYDTFVFCADMCEITRSQLYVPNKEKLIRRAKYLYLFGGQKTMLPLTCILAISMFIKIALATVVPTWALWISVLTTFFAIVLFARYRNSVKMLKSAMMEQSIMQYMHSSRPEKKSFSDELVQKNLDFNSGRETYY